MVIREATEADLSAITSIYNDAVLNTTAIWNEATSDIAGRRDWWLGRVSSGFPVLVASKDRQCVGYATYGYFRPNDGYRHSRELSIYVDQAFRGQGVADALMLALERHAIGSGVHVLVGGLEAGNTPSKRLHEKHGYRQAAYLPQVGRKFDRWLDLILMVKILKA